jgi:hypothetical protein
MCYMQGARQQVNVEEELPIQLPPIQCATHKGARQQVNVEEELFLALTALFSLSDMTMSLSSILFLVVTV